MADVTFKMPDVGEGVVEAEIVEWHVKVGEVVREDDPMLDVMTDKATVEVPAPATGTVVSLNGAVGDVVPVGTVVIVIRPDGDAAPADAAADAPRVLETADAEPVAVAAPEPAQLPAITAPPAPPARPASAPAPAIARTGERPLASPAVRQRARDSDVDLARVPGTGPAGRVTHDDLDDFIAAGGRLAVRGAGALRAPRTGVRETKVIGLRRKISENMVKAWSIPHITYADEIDVTNLEELRRELNAKRQDDQPKLTLMPFLCLAIVKSIEETPQANAHHDAEAGALTEFDAAHIGIATATDKGLMVPVLRHVEAMDVWTIAAETKRLAEACRDGTAAREELSGSTITITSLGAIGGVVTTPIINAPETAIVGVNKIQERPAFDDAGRVVPRLFMNLSCSFDHRIVDGFEAASLVQTIKAGLEHPATLFM